MFKLWDIVAWANYLLYFALRVPAKLLALVVVPFLDDYHRTFHPIWGCRDTTDLSYYNIAIKNGAHNAVNKDAVKYYDVTNTPGDPTLEQLSGYQWRIRRSVSGNYISYRFTWGEPRKSKGKREIYFGWVMNEKPTIRPTFQVRIR